MATHRSYGDTCGIARALDVVGERWSLLVVRELLLGPKRFTDLRAGLPSMSADVLADRLRELEATGVVSRGTLAPPAASRVYELTDRGRELEPVVLALGRWGSPIAMPADASALSADAFLVALKTLFDPSAAEGADAAYEIRIGLHVFAVRVVSGRLDVARGPVPRADAVVSGGTSALAAVLWHGRSLTDAERAGDVTVTGSRQAVKRLRALFPAPQPSSASGRS